ncbi:hypothetical protein TrVGV298_010358 [Trichoderma virens]|nr:hypothetical protein TrVGV298_010358 [Trichoderma virens]
MEEVQKNIWKISFRSSEIQPVEVVQPVLGVVKLANDFIVTALASNPYASLAWVGVSALLSLFLNPMDQATSLAKGLEYISALIAKCYCYYTNNKAIRLGHDLTGRYDWSGMIEKIRQQESQMAAINQAWSDTQYDEECAAAQERHKEAMHSLVTVGADISGLRKAVEEANAKQDHQNFYRWLCDVDPSDMYNAARKRHEAGTSEWFMENEKFESWMNNPRSLLWLHGKGMN